MSASACGGSGEPTGTSPSLSVVRGAACETADARVKPVPAAARDLVRAFVAALARGDRAAARRALDPTVADEVLGALAPVERLALLSLSDDY